MAFLSLVPLLQKLHFVLEKAILFICLWLLLSQVLVAQSVPELAHDHQVCMSNALVMVKKPPFERRGQS